MLVGESSLSFMYNETSSKLNFQKCFALMAPLALAGAADDIKFG